MTNAFYTSALSNITNEIYNVGSGYTVSINKIIDFLGGEKVFIPKRPGEPDTTFADITKIKKDMQWEPKVKIEEGIKILIENIEYWKNAPVWNPDSISEATIDWFKYLK